MGFQYGSQMPKYQRNSGKIKSNKRNIIDKIAISTKKNAEREGRNLSSEDRIFLESLGLKLRS